MATASPDHDDDQATLERLNRQYPNWKVWRSKDDRGRPAAWVATNKRGHDSVCAPTLHEPTAAKLEAQLQAPPLRHCKPFALVAEG
ncbi:hypothetical protein FZ103_00670 [Streptomonospora sp. PA3]|uniref:hypothetical protein n=1 Tax=Streptomonospora sp. PA3 TaxID=2607326 RepID=UPI0012DDA5BA|nr:hypothetical protein [Streptomonospora sp. PA3]MUL39705.1 hypothetical protein [Streptomonospora sp. PA3]